MTPITASDLRFALGCLAVLVPFIVVAAWLDDSYRKPDIGVVMYGTRGPVSYGESWRRMEECNRQQSGGMER